MSNFVRILRRPLIGNVHAPLKKELPDDISLQDAIREAVEYGRDNHQQPDYLYHNGIQYNFTAQGVIEMGGEKGNRMIGKVHNPYYNGNR